MQFRGRHRASERCQPETPGTRKILVAPEGLETHAGSIGCPLSAHPAERSEIPLAVRRSPPNGANRRVCSSARVRGTCACWIVLGGWCVVRVCAYVYTDPNASAMYTRAVFILLFLAYYKHTRRHRVCAWPRFIASNQRTGSTGNNTAAPGENNAGQALAANIGPWQRRRRMCPQLAAQAW